MIIQFNWCEIKSISDDPVDQLILLLCQTVRQDDVLAHSYTSLRYRLKIKYINNKLIDNGYIEESEAGIIPKYKTEEPQSYFINPSFLYGTSNPIQKTDYAHILSQRHLRNKNTYIPLKYVASKYHKNIFTFVKNHQIHLPLEKINDKKLGRPKETTSTRKWA